MDRDELVRRLLATFQVELDDHGPALQRDLLALEKATGAARVELVDSLFRTAHTIKGAARAVGSEVIEAAVRAVEDLLGQARDGTRVIDPEAVSLLLEVVDALADASRGLASGQPLEGRAIDSVLPRLQAAARGDAPTAPAPVAQPQAITTAEPRADRLDLVAQLAAELLEKVDHAGDRGGVARLAHRLGDAIDDLRLVQLGGATLGLDRTVRDLALSLGKEAELTVEGELLELDRAIVAGLRDPLLHLVRNAIDHGIETPSDRVGAGKPAVGRITVAARLAGDLVEVTVTDDGRGLDRAGIAQAMARRGLAAARDDGGFADATFLPGLSTARMVTDVSGRGVGLDAVRDRVQALRGTAELELDHGRGVRAVLRVPRSLARLRVIVVDVAGQSLAIPAAYIERVVRVDPGELRPISGRESLVIGDGAVPVVSLARLIDLRDVAGARGKLVVAVLATGRRRVGLIVDRAIAEREVSMRSLGARLRGIRHLIGAATIDGHPVVVLDAAELLRRGLADTAPALPPPAHPSVARQPRLLLVDDSLTTRTLERIILEAAGYHVTVAIDGAEAWQYLQDGPIDLVVSDVEMPKLDGVGLCERIRATPRLAELPVVLVTALARDRDRARGLAAGASAYIVKSAFDQQGLLDIIRQLLP